MANDWASQHIALARARCYGTYLNNGDIFHPPSQHDVAHFELYFHVTWTRTGTKDRPRAQYRHAEPLCPHHCNVIEHTEEPEERGIIMDRCWHTANKHDHSMPYSSMNCKKYSFHPFLHSALHSSMYQSVVAKAS